MPKKCRITQKKPMFGNNRSHAMNATKKKFSPNLQYHRFWIPSKKKFIKLRVSIQGMRIIDKQGIEKALNISSQIRNK